MTTTPPSLLQEHIDEQQIVNLVLQLIDDRLLFVIQFLQLFDVRLLFIAEAAHINDLYQIVQEEQYKIEETLCDGMFVKDHDCVDFLLVC